MLNNYQHNTSNVSVQPRPAAVLDPYAHYNYGRTTTVDIQKNQKPADSLVYRIASVLFFFAFTITILVLLAESHSEDDKEACGKDLWPLILTRLIGNVVEWLILFLMGVSVPPPGLLQKIITVSKLAFAIAFTVILPAAVASGCTEVSRNWYALVVVSWIFLVIDWIAAVAGFIIALTASGSAGR